MNNSSLETVTYYIWGDLGKILISLLLWCAQISVFIGAFLLTSEMIVNLLCITPTSPSCISPIKANIFIGIFSLIVACIPSLKTFSYISTLSIMIMFASLFLMFYHSCSDLSQMEDLQVHLGKETFLFDISMFPQSMGCLLYTSPSPRD